MPLALTKSPYSPAMGAISTVAEARQPTGQLLLYADLAARPEEKRAKTAQERSRSALAAPPVVQDTASWKSWWLLKLPYPMAVPSYMARAWRRRGRPMFFGTHAAAIDMARNRKVAGLPILLDLHGAWRDGTVIGPDGLAEGKAPAAPASLSCCHLVQGLPATARTFTRVGATAAPVSGE